MSRLPIISEDRDEWGEIILDWLRQHGNENGSLKESAVLDALGNLIILPGIIPGANLSNQGNSPYWLDRVGNTLYVLFTVDKVVKAYDITSGTPSTTPLWTSPLLGASPAYLKVRGTLAYVTDQSSLDVRVIDFANTSSITVTSPVAYSSGGSGGGRFDITPDGLHMLVGGPESGVNANKIYLLNVSGSIVSAAGSVASAGSTLRGVVALSNTTWAISSRDDHTVKLIDAIVPAAPTVASSINITIIIDASLLTSIQLNRFLKNSLAHAHHAPHPSPTTSNTTHPLH